MNKNKEKIKKYLNEAIDIIEAKGSRRKMNMSKEVYYSLVIEIAKMLQKEEHHYDKLPKE